MDHGHGITDGRGHEVDLGHHGICQRMFEHHHREYRRARAHVARTLCDGVRGDHACARITLGRAERTSRPEVACGVEHPCTVWREMAGTLSRNEHARQQVLYLPRNAARRHARIELLDHAVVVVLGHGVNRKHARGIPHREAVLAREEPVRIARKRREGGDARNVLLTVNDGLIDMGDAPPFGDVEREELGKLVSSDRRRGVAPGTERYEQPAFVIKRQVSMHHRRDAHGAKGVQRHTIAPLHVSLERRVGGLDARGELVLGVGPVRPIKRVLPVEGTDGDGVVVRIVEHGLDARRSVLDPKGGLGTLDILEYLLCRLCHLFCSS